MSTIYFTKRFTSGNLTGLSVIGQGYARTIEECATRWRIGARGSDCITHARWIITDASFQNYAR